MARCTLSIFLGLAVFSTDILCAQVLQPDEILDICKEYNAKPGAIVFLEENFRIQSLGKIKQKTTYSMYRSSLDIQFTRKLILPYSGVDTELLQFFILPMSYMYFELVSVSIYRLYDAVLDKFFNKYHVGILIEKSIDEQFNTIRLDDVILKKQFERQYGASMFHVFMITLDSAGLFPSYLYIDDNVIKLAPNEDEEMD